ncbi:MAG: hypothetical protein Q8R43_02405, partial [Alphaproteobacteria bacterium]|nr:hypothetical protein [Alphaproteobacteria bacterium]
TTKIQKAWMPIFSNPQEKAYLVKLLSHYWISKNLDGSLKQVQSTLKKALTESIDIETLHAALQELSPRSAAAPLAATER